ncbi:hypothetical protein EYF80_040618 [Liparis tanakae]|uniref:Uncharacterized protein n=1 Tax=Liparis tanakae TaxID=230148 RepID=A0A4Z2G6Q5_9TELE|nr:hypothetical protein EYF80_040618 [Liparis tanakae]
MSSDGEADEDVDVMKGDKADSSPAVRPRPAGEQLSSTTISDTSTAISSSTTDAKVGAAGTEIEHVSSGAAPRRQDIYHLSPSLTPRCFPGPPRCSGSSPLPPKTAEAGGK